jgi:hypothetical protein
MRSLQFVSSNSYRVLNVQSLWSQVNAYTVYASRKLAELGRAIGKQAEAAQLEARANRTAAAMRARLIDHNTGLFVDGLGRQSGGPPGAAPRPNAANHSAWHAQTVTLWLGVAPTSSHTQMLRFLAKRGMVGSVYGAFAMLLGLYEIGMSASVASFQAAVLTEIYLCNVGSCQEILRRHGRG